MVLLFSSENRRGTCTNYHSLHPILQGIPIKLMNIKNIIYSNKFVKKSLLFLHMYGLIIIDIIREKKINDNLNRGIFEEKKFNICRILKIILY